MTTQPMRLVRNGARPLREDDIIHLRSSLDRVDCERQEEEEEEESTPLDSSEQGWKHGAASCRTASPTHHQMSYSGLSQKHT